MQDIYDCRFFTDKAQSMFISRRQPLVDALILLRFLSMAVPAIILSPQMPSHEVSSAFLWLYPSISSLVLRILSPEAAQSVTKEFF